MPLITPEVRPLTDSEKATLKAMLRAFGTDVADVKAQVFPSLVVMPGARVRYVGKIFLLSNASTPIAIARNAFGRHFPSMDGRSAATQFASLVLLMEQARDEPSSLRAAYLASPLTNEYCVAAVKTQTTQVEWVARPPLGDGTPQMESWATFAQHVDSQLNARGQARRAAIEQIPAELYAPTN